MLERPPMIGPLLSAMNVSPSQARPRMPMTAVSPALQVLVLTISPAGAPVTRIMMAARASITMAIVIGMLTTIGAGALGAGGATAGRSAGIVLAVSGASGSADCVTAGAVVAVFAASGSV